MDCNVQENPEWVKKPKNMNYLEFLRTSNRKKCLIEYFLVQIYVNEIIFLSKILSISSKFYFLHLKIITPLKAKINSPYIYIFSS